MHQGFDQNPALAAMLAGALQAHQQKQQAELPMPQGVYPGMARPFIPQLGGQFPGMMPPPHPHDHPQAAVNPWVGAVPAPQAHPFPGLAAIFQHPQGFHPHAPVIGVAPDANNPFATPHVAPAGMYQAY